MLKLVIIIFIERIKRCLLQYAFTFSVELWRTESCLVISCIGGVHSDISCNRESCLDISWIGGVHFDISCNWESCLDNSFLLTLLGMGGGTGAG